MTPTERDHDTTDTSAATEREFMRQLAALTEDSPLSDRQTATLLSQHASALRSAVNTAGGHGEMTVSTPGAAAQTLVDDSTE